MRRASSTVSQGSNADHVLKYKDMKPIVERTQIYKDEQGNLALNEADLHKMFVGLTRREDDPTKRLYMYEKDLVKRLPAIVQRRMKFCAGKEELSNQ